MIATCDASHRKKVMTMKNNDEGWIWGMTLAVLAIVPAFLVGCLFIWLVVVM